MEVHISNKKEEADRVVPESQQGPIEVVPAHEKSFAASPPQAASPDPTAEINVLAEENKRKPRLAD